MALGASAAAAMVQTAEGPTFVRTVGAGPPIIVVHGGPGFDHTYLVEPLKFLTRRRMLVFYDQPGCGQTPVPRDGVSLAQTASHFRALMLELFGKTPAGIIAHSWGALIAVAGFAGGAEPAPAAPGEGILVNPVAITTKAYLAALQRLLARLPEEAIAGFFEILRSGGHGSDAMRLILPYYRTRDFVAAPQDFPLTPSTYLQIAENLGDFDFTAGVPAVKDLAVLVGADDFTGLDLVPELVGATKTLIVMPGASHFPFFEDPDRFAAEVGSLIR
jgi:proline iminopeptidase